MGKAAPIGTICVIDYVPRSLTDGQRDALRELSNVAVSLIEGRRSALEAAEQAEQQRHMMHRLIYEQRKFEQAERMASIGYWRLDLESKAIHWSDQVYAIHGLPVGSTPPLEGAYNSTLHTRAKWWRSLLIRQSRQDSRLTSKVIF